MTEPIDFSALEGMKFKTILADPPWRFKNRSGVMSPETNQRNDKYHYPTMSLGDIKKMPVKILACEDAYLYLWTPSFMLPDGLNVMKEWGFKYRNTIVWRKIKKDGSTSASSLGFPFRNAQELLLVGYCGNLKKASVIKRESVHNIICDQKREHSRKPDQTYDLIEKVSLPPYLELFARTKRPGWEAWGNQTDKFI